MNEAKKEGISLRQSYKIKGKKEAAQSARYFHAKQYRRGKASVKKQRNWLGRVIRDIEKEKFRRKSRKITKSFGIRRENIQTGEKEQREDIQFT